MDIEYTTEGIEDLPGLIAECRHELHRLQLNWRAARVLDYCEKATGKRDAHYLTAIQLQSLLAKLQVLPTPKKEVKPGTKVKACGQEGVVKEWDEDIECWIVEISGKEDVFDLEDLEVVR